MESSCINKLLGRFAGISKYGNKTALAVWIGLISLQGPNISPRILFTLSLGRIYMYKQAFRLL